MPEYVTNPQSTNIVNAFIEQYNRIQREHPDKTLMILDEKQNLIREMNKVNDDLIQLILETPLPTIRLIHPNHFDLTIKVIG